MDEKSMIKMSVTVNYQLKCLLFTRSPSETWQLRSSPSPSDTLWALTASLHLKDTLRILHCQSYEQRRSLSNVVWKRSTPILSFCSAEFSHATNHVLLIIDSKRRTLPTQPSKTACASSRLHSLTALTSETFMLGKLLSNRPSFSRQRTGINTALSAGRQRMTNENIIACLRFTEERKSISVAYHVGFMTHLGRYRIMIARCLVSFVDDRSAHARMSIINAGSRPFDFEETKRERKKWRAH